MILLLALVLGTVLLIAAWRRLEYLGYLEMGKEYERQQALIREWKVGIPYDPEPRESGRR